MLVQVPLYRSIFSNGPGQDVLVRAKTMHILSYIKSFFLYTQFFYLASQGEITGKRNVCPLVDRLPLVLVPRDSGSSFHQLLNWCAILGRHEMNPQKISLYNAVYDSFSPRPLE